MIEFDDDLNINFTRSFRTINSRTNLREILEFDFDNKLFDIFEIFEINETNI